MIEIYIYIYIYICIYIKSHGERWVKCCHFKLSILHKHLISFRFCLLCSKQESVGYSHWGKQHRDAIHASRNLETTYCAARHSRQKLQYKNWRVSWNQSEDSFILIKSKHRVHFMMFGAVIRNGDIMPPFIFPHNSLWRPTSTAWKR